MKPHHVEVRTERITHSALSQVYSLSRFSLLVLYWLWFLLEHDSNRSFCLLESDSHILLHIGVIRARRQRRHSYRADLAMVTVQDVIRPAFLIRKSPKHVYGRPPLRRTCAGMKISNLFTPSEIVGGNDSDHRCTLPPKAQVRAPTVSTAPCVLNGLGSHWEQDRHLATPLLSEDLPSRTNVDTDDGCIAHRKLVVNDVAGADGTSPKAAVRR
ncbi:hypothetical protein NP233_g9997 [Leucocoprinus birnbaumii]|uniref:Uncharacterized protein n=1 Tax=Leucocoprinus birnbaumii TaxID=56174 RepID=A0AAD5YSB6_9AGAR|nr:hypothetical protein NP233_g9997 [Leucocoprinus birnbaumii]